MERNILIEAMMRKADPAQAVVLSRFFKCGKGGYGEGDKFLGVKVPVIRSTVKELWPRVTFESLDESVRSEFHEIRMASLLALVEIFRRAREDEERRRQCVDFYLSHTAYINNWDLVDLSCYPLLGEWLLDKDRKLLYDLARNGGTIWEQRIGIVSTMQFIRVLRQTEDTFAIADIFMRKNRPLHDLLQKAVGWLLREAGKKDESKLKAWLDINASSMPRTMLRYSIERLSAEDKARYMAR